MTERERKRMEAEERFAAEHPDQHMRRREFLARTAGLAGLAGLASVLPADTLVSQAARKQVQKPFPSPKNMPIDHIVVLMMENRSFDHYLGWHPDADAKNSGLTYPDAQGNPHATHPLAPDFQGCAFPDPDHSWDGARLQYNNGAVDGFYVNSTDPDEQNNDFALGYYEKKDLGFLPAAADAFTMYDRFFCSLLGPTWPNREYMHSAQSGGNKKNGSPAEVVAAGASGGLYKWETIWDRVLAAGLSATYYFNDLPFIGVFGPRYVPITKSIDQFYADCAAGTLPNVAFVDPPFLDGGGGRGLSGDEHPHGDIRIGQSFMAQVVNAFVRSSNFRRGALFITYDEWGGFFDHVPPRVMPDDRQSPDLNENFGVTGFRTPGVAVSPFVKRGHVSHATVTFESILKLISYRFGLGFLTMRHRYASNIGRTFDFDNPNFKVPDLPSPPPPATGPCGGSGRTAREGSTPADGETSREGLTIGDPIVRDYLESNGYTIHEPSVKRSFNHHRSRRYRRLSEQWKAQGGGR